MDNKIWQELEGLKNRNPYGLNNKLAFEEKKARGIMEKENCDLEISIDMCINETKDKNLNFFL